MSPDQVAAGLAHTRALGAVNAVLPETDEIRGLKMELLRLRTEVSTERQIRVAVCDYLAERDEGFQAILDDVTAKRAEDMRLAMLPRVYLPSRELCVCKGAVDETDERTIVTLGCPPESPFHHLSGRTFEHRHKGDAGRLAAAAAEDAIQEFEKQRKVSAAFGEAASSMRKGLEVVQ